jgi:DNA-binding NtrC family response regulator
MSRTNPSILVVDDEPRIADILVLIFNRAGYTASAVYNAHDALMAIGECAPELIIADVVMPGLDGIELAKLIHATHPECRILLFSGNADTQQMLVAAESQGHAFEILAKPVPPPKMLAKVAEMLAEQPRRAVTSDVA